MTAFVLQVHIFGQWFRTSLEMHNMNKKVQNIIIHIYDKNI